MTTLNQYLEDIAVAVLRPLGYLYAKQGATEGQYGYSGVHPDTDGHIRGKWQQMASVSLDDPFGTDASYKLYWTIQDDGQQGSWWVKQ